MAKSRRNESKLYYYIDIDPYSKQILAWDIQTRETMQVDPGNGCYRVFLSKGQYNKLVAKLEAAQS